MLKLSRKNWWKDTKAAVGCANTLAYYSRRTDYRFKFDFKHATAYVDYRSKVVGMNPNFPKVRRNEKANLRHLPKNWRNFWIKGYLAHEAAHIVFTKPTKNTLKGGALGQMANILEDERIERLMAHKDPSLKAVFDTLGDVFLQRQTNQSAYACCLYWRWYHDRQDTMPCNEPQLWQQVQPLVEQAWTAAKFEEVVQLASQILAVLGIEEQSQPIALPFCEVGGGGGLDSNQGETGGGVRGSGGNQGPAGGGLQQPESPDDEESPEVLPEEKAIFDDNNAEDLLDEIEGYARELATMLYIPQQPSLARASRSGRFSYDRYIRQSERYFEKKVFHPRKGIPEIRLAIDISGSMSGERILCAKEVAATFVRTAQILGTTYQIRAFNSMDHELPSGKRFEECFKVIGGLIPAGGTELYPSLKRLLQGQQALVVIICDGGLGDSDFLACQKLLRNSPHMVLPVLLEVDASTVERYERYFGKALVAPSTAQLLPLIKAFVRAWWQG